jgi:hypothetical protein
MDQPSMAPNTTRQDDMVTAGQRRVNLVWEITQAVIAIMITAAIIFIEIKRIDSPVLSNAFFLIVAMYFVRTNHQKIGGVGSKPENQTR